MKIGNKRATKKAAKPDTHGRISTTIGNPVSTMGRVENYFPRHVGKQHPISKSGMPAKKKATKK